MGKNNRHKKNIKSEKSKVKLKQAKAKLLPKGQNITDTTFKVKKIVIREQLKEHDQSEILSRRKLNVKDLLTRFHHHNSSVRQEAIKELDDILKNHPSEILNSNLSTILQGLGALVLDREQDIRRDTLKTISLILGSIKPEYLAPFSGTLISYLCCAMTHITPAIKEDSLNFLDIIVEKSCHLIAKNSQKILSLFLDFISKNQTQSNRQLSTTLSSKLTTVKWRNKVFDRLSSIFSTIINDIRLRYYSQEDSMEEKKINIQEKTFYLPLYKNDTKLFHINFDNNCNDLISKKYNSEFYEFIKYIDVLMPLIFESWVEVRPQETSGENSSLISNDTKDFLTSITSIMQLIIQFIDIVKPKIDDANIALDFCNKYKNNISKYFMNSFPYSFKAVQIVADKKTAATKRQNDFESAVINTRNRNCLEQNLALSYIYMWIVSYSQTNRLNEISKQNCQKIVQFVNDSLNYWYNDPSIVSQLIKLVRLILINCSKILYKSGVNLESTVRAIIATSLKDSTLLVNIKLFKIFGDILLDQQNEINQ
ncbi:GSCOCG00006988001-RA-CDS [Cotesia congregata]|nr:GSCOCG00006988001-RA-CDS [Cotesia congregata]